MIKLYVVEEKGRSLTQEYLNDVLEYCSIHFRREELDYTGGYKYNDVKNLLEEIEKESDKGFTMQAIAFIHSEGKQVFICCEDEFDEFVDIAKSKEFTSTSEVLKKMLN